MKVINTRRESEALEAELNASLEAGPSAAQLRLEAAREKNRQELRELDNCAIPANFLRS